jgi:hypothetical protein
MYGYIELVFMKVGMFLKVLDLFVNGILFFTAVPIEDIGSILMVLKWLH